MTASPFSAVGQGDVAQAWIDYLLRGNNLPEALSAYAAPLAFVAHGLREALGVYSYGMLMIAAFLVFYHITAMVVETAHTGVPFGRRANQLWTPIRFVFAIALLMPVSSGLSVGQHLVIYIAGQGSSMASHAWKTIAESTNAHLSGLVTPQGPNVAQIVTGAVEMEMCHLTYTGLYAPLANDTVVHLAGDITDIVKIPADHLSGETLRYTNALNADVPLCGEYRFAGYHMPSIPKPLATDSVTRMADELAGFAHTQANDLETQAVTIAGHAAPVFVGPTAPIGADIHSDLAGLEKTFASRLDDERRTIAGISTGIADQTLADSINAGWLAAASFIPEFVRLQESYSELMDHALPEVQAPVFPHRQLTRQVLADAVRLSLAFAPLEGHQPERLVEFYDHVSRVTGDIHTWLYGTQLQDKDFIAPSGNDLREHFNVTTEPAAAASYLARALDSAAIAHGVWGQEGDSTDTGYPFAVVPSSASYNPFGALVEFGRRQVALANEISGLAGSGLSISGATGASVLLGLTGIAFLLGGLLLIFVVPLLPFLRFLLAVLVWGINLFEGVLAVPVVALAHLTPVGGGLSGNLARQAYLLWLALLIRPLLTLLGFAFGLLLFVLSISFLNAVLAPFAHMSVAGGSGILTVANIGLVLVYDGMVYAAANICFKSIYWLPDNAMRWISPFVATDPGDATPPVVNVNTNGGGGPTGFAAISNLIRPYVSNVMSGMNMGGGNTSGGASATSNNALKAALMPEYSDKAAAPDLALGAMTGTPFASSTMSTSTSASHFGDRSTDGGTTGRSGDANINITNVPAGTTVNVSTNVMPGSIGAHAQKRREEKNDKSRFSESKHGSDVGGKERGTDKPDTKPDTPKD